MALEVESLCGAGYGDRTAERAQQRHGDRERTWDTRAGPLALQIPKRRKGASVPGFLEPRRTAEKAPTAVRQEADGQGVSTRRVDELVQALGLTGLSQSQVSRWCEGPSGHAGGGTSTSVSPPC